MNIALIIAGGSGQRMMQDIPKQFINVDDKPIIVYTLEAFQIHANIDIIAVVCLEGWEQVLWAYAKQFNITKLKHVIKGGKNGQDSIRNGLFELEKQYESDSLVLIHDAIRPNVSQEIISDCIVKIKQYGNGVACIPCTEAVMETENGVDSVSSYPRDKLKRTQTPQGFILKDICELHRDAVKVGITNSVASCTLMAEMGKKIYFSAGSEKNIKLTTVEDIEIFKALLQSRHSAWLKTKKNLLNI